jgi:uncharacterized protein involved in high-affinity Fe2+ transport
MGVLLIAGMVVVVIVVSAVIMEYRKSKPVPDVGNIGVMHVYKVYIQPKDITEVASELTQLAASKKPGVVEFYQDDTHMVRLIVD